MLKFSIENTKTGMRRLLTFACLCFSLPNFGQNKILKVACVGNSVTYGYGLKYREQDSYPSQLQKQLGSNYRVMNFGHNGATLLKAGHNAYDKTPEFTAALTFSPDIAIIHLGLNDTDPRDWPDYKENFEADYADLISAFRESNPAVKVYICRLTPIFSEHPRFKSGTRDWYWQIQQLMPAIASANQVELIDLHSRLYHRPELFADNLHPNKEGAGIIAQTVYQALTKDFGGFKLADVFAPHMVLQRDQPIKIYGTANTGEPVTVKFKNTILNTVTGEDGSWEVQFPGMAYGGPFEMTITCQNKPLVLNDILIGDVWLCSGQSNMAFTLSKSSGGKAELKNATENTRLRLYQYKLLKETDAVVWDTTVLNKVNELQYFSGAWQTCNEGSAADFSAVAYEFGKKLTQDEKIPIGLIQVAVGGSPIESWIDRYTLEHDPVMVDVMTNWRKSDFFIKFCRDRADINLRQAINPKQRHPYDPCYNYEAAIEGLTKFAIKGVIWYQGESNAHNLELYQHAFHVLVESWREKWAAPLPFYFAQLSAIDRPSWPAFRYMESKLPRELPNVHMAVSMDLGDSLNVHYLQKKPLGDRLALLALHYTYKKSIVAEAPQPLYALQQENLISVTFPAGTKLKGTGDRALEGFEVVNVKGQRLLPIAAIQGNTIQLRCPVGEQIKMVYYAMQPFTRANLTNSTGLPVSTFVLSLDTTKHKFLMN